VPLRFELDDGGALHAVHDVPAVDDLLSDEAVESLF
jgi:hypothetical protein